MDRVLVDAPQAALQADPYAAESLDLTEPGPQTHKLLTIRALEVWPDGTVDDINIRTVQSNQWCDAVGAREGAEVPLPLDLVDMGLPEGLTGTVLSIQQCPQPPPGPGRLVLTTVNHLNRDVIELDLRGPDGRLETLRPTGNHKFYSVTRGSWLSAGELREGEQLDGVGGLVTVERKRTLPGTHRVYNLTVQGEHLYRVATSGVLVHNNCGRLVYDHASKSWRSNAGLIYGQGSIHGNRVRHVLAHLSPDPAKAAHTVFNVKRNQLIGLIDEAWLRRGTSRLEGSLRVFEIDMGRAVGTNGETWIRLVVRDGTSELISAYPIPWP